MAPLTLHAHDRPADLAVRADGEADHAVDAPIRTLLLGPGLGLGADELARLPLELVLTRLSAPRDQHQDGLHHCSLTEVRHRREPAPIRE